MDWEKLLNSNRLNDASYADSPNRPMYVQDADRIVFSASFRRLANKTQVHPLYENDHVHHRLIHSIETGSIGRSIGTQIGDWLEISGYINKGEKHTIAGIVHAACLAHDIGNPPFGHSGEDAIGHWFQEKFQTNLTLFNSVEGPLRTEFEKFEGNAQGFRVITRLEMYRNEGGMRLSHGVLGAFTKYPTTSSVRSIETSSYCGLKKFGVFHSERQIFSEVADAIGLIEKSNANGNWWKRHPLAFLVEAADDICYNILDLEDAFASGDLEFKTVHDHLCSIAGVSNLDESDRTPEEKIAYARARSIGSSIEACVEAFKNNYSVIMDGTFSGSLIESSIKSDEFKRIKNLSTNKIFIARRKTELEILGRNVVRKVLDGVLPIYEELSRFDWEKEKLEGYNAQLIRAIGIDLRGASCPYSALHSMADFVSGMTDRYAVRIARMVSAG